MMWRSRWCGRLVPILGALVWVAPISGRAWVPKNAPDEARLREAEELKESYERLGQKAMYGDATGLAGRACRILEEEHGKTSTRLADCFNDLAVLYGSQGEYEQAALLLKRALVIVEKAWGPEHLDVARILNNLAALYSVQEEQGKAESLFVRALAIREKAQGPAHPDVASSLLGLGSVHFEQGRYKSAEVLLLRALNIWEATQDIDQLDLANCLNNLGRLYQRQDKYDEAESLLGRALVIREVRLGAEHPDVAQSLNNLAALYQNRGQFRKASLFLMRALAIWEPALGPEHPDVAQGVNNLAGLYWLQGEYRKAKPLFLRALAINEKVMGPHSPRVATSLNNLAILYRDQGEYGKAERYHERALAILESVLGPGHPDLASSINNLALIHKDQGDFGRAAQLYERALVIREATLGPEHSDAAQSLNNLAQLRADQGDSRKAERLFERALVIHEKRLGPDHVHYATVLNNLATLYQQQGQYGKAEQQHALALTIREEGLGPSHPSVANSASSLALLFREQGKYKEAERLFERALAIHHEALGPHHPHVALNLHGLAALYYDQGEYGAAVGLHLRALEVEQVNLSRTLVIADEARRLAYTSTLSGSLQFALSLHLRAVPKHHAMAELGLTTLLRRKNRVQDLIMQSNSALRRSLPEEDRHLLDDLADIDSQISVLSNRGPGKLGIEAFSQEHEKFRQQRDRLWSSLAKHNALVESLNHPITIEDVQRALPNGSALLELAQYVPQHGDDGKSLRKHDPKPPARYAAYILFPDRFAWVDLGPAAPIDEHVETFRRAIQTRQAIPTDLYDAVMRPIVDKLGDARHLIIAPAGNLSLIPFGALHNGDQYLIEKYDLRYVTTGRDLLPPPATPPVTTTPVTIVANPVGANLPDAELEAEFLSTLFPKTRVLLDTQATETNVRTIERPLVLHMATHGFFGEARNERDNPLFRSGLYLADIDQVEVDRERDDGQLTAYEVSGMDLRGSQLVVLSACETGLGAAVKAEGKELMSEGVAGLRRSFAMAGARTTVMSLWEVSGVTAQKTMESYYRKLAEGMGRGEAMQAVQLEMLRTEEHRHPKDWAAFIVSGDDTPMVFPEGEGPRVEEEPPGPPPVSRRPHGCSVAAPSPDRDPSVPAFLLGLLGLGVLRRRRG